MSDSNHVPYRISQACHLSGFYWSYLDQRYRYVHDQPMGAYASLPIPPPDVIVSVRIRR